MEIGLFEAKQKLSELVERASQGEEVVITRRGRKLARLVPMPAHRTRRLKAIFDSIREARIKLPKGMTVKDLIEREGILEIPRDGRIGGGGLDGRCACSGRSITRFEAD